MRPAHLILAALVLIALALAAATRGWAAMLGDASVPFRAERTVTVDGRTYSGPLYQEPGHQRHEQDLYGMHEVFLLDIKAARGYLVLPSVNTYIEFPFPALMAELGSPDLTRTPLGEENIAGLDATKYRVDHLAQDGSRAQGYLWVTRTGILVKLDISMTRPHGGKPIAIAMALSHIERGAVDPALFVLPPGLVALPPSALGPLLGGQPG
jgi:hypothetical protein